MTIGDFTLPTGCADWLPLLLPLLTSSTNRPGTRPPGLASDLDTTTSPSSASCRRLFQTPTPYHPFYPLWYRPAGARQPPSVNLLRGSETLPAPDLLGYADQQGERFHRHCWLPTANNVSNTPEAPDIAINPNRPSLSTNAQPVAPDNTSPLINDPSGSTPEVWQDMTLPLSLTRWPLANFTYPPQWRLVNLWLCWLDLPSQTDQLERRKLLQRFGLVRRLAATAVAA